MTGFIASLCKGNKKAHTKVGECSMFEGTPHGFIIHDKGKFYSLDETAFNIAIQAGIIAVGSDRIIPLLGGITDYQPTGGDVRTSQEGFGPETPIGINAKRVDYIINEGGLCLFKELGKLNGKQIRLFPVDKSKIAYGTIATIEGENHFRGFLAKLWRTKRDNTGSQTGAIILSVFYDADYENEENAMAAIALTGDVEGLTGVVLKRTGAGKAKFVVACSGEDLTEAYGATLATAALYTDATGSNPTTVTYANGELTFDPVGKYMIGDAATLNAADIEGYEGEEEYTDLT